VPRPTALRLACLSDTDRSGRGTTTTILDRGGLEESQAHRGYPHADWESIVTSLKESTLERIAACEVCGDLAHYEGRGCADRYVVKLCVRCLDMAITT
jgi:hypothetical protein